MLPRCFGATKSSSEVTAFRVTDRVDQNVSLKGGNHSDRPYWCHAERSRAALDSPALPSGQSPGATFTFSAIDRRSCSSETGCWGISLAAAPAAVACFFSAWGCTPGRREGTRAGYATSRSTRQGEASHRAHASLAAAAAKCARQRSHSTVAAVGEAGRIRGRHKCQ